MLTIDNLIVRYGAIEALHGVSLRVQRGQIVSLIGANGAGKTTLLRAVSGLIPACSGTIAYQPNGQLLQLNKLPAHRIVEAHISHVPEGRGIFGSMTVRENLELGAYLRRDAGIAADRERVFTLFPRVKERLSQTASTLSGGEQQMLAIGRALMSKPQVLLLDEPSLGLAPLLVEQIFTVIKEINAQGTTVLLVEQNAHMALRIAHYAYVLETGNVVLEGRAAEVACNDQVRKAYLGEE
jgi:branched-chain amino acid transport system ATP-binding protein